MRVLYLVGTELWAARKRALLDLVRAVCEARPDWSLDLVVPVEGDFSAGASMRSKPYPPLPPAIAQLGDARAGGEAYFDLAQAEDGACRYPQARDDYQHAIELSPDRPEYKASSRELLHKIAEDASSGQ